MTTLLKKIAAKYKAILVSLLSGLLAICANSQSVTSYTFAASSSTFTALSGASTPTLSSGSSDDGIFNNIPIGFDFWYMGTQYSTASASTNGWITLGSNITDAMYSNDISAGGNPRPVIAPLWDDLSFASATNITYSTTGSAGSRVFAIQWLNARWDYSNTANCITLQVKLYETTGRIEFHYRTSLEPGSLISPSASIGITAAATGSGNFRSLNNSSAFPTVSSITATNTIATKPANNQLYSFTPPTPAAPGTLSFSSITASSMTLNWTDLSSNERGFVIYRSTDGISYTLMTQVGAGVTSSNQTGLSVGTTYYWRVYSVSEGAFSTPLSGNQMTTCSAPAISQIPTSNLILHYKLNGNANDATGNNNGTLQNAPLLSTDRFGNASSAYTLNGTNQHITTTNSYTNPQNFTISIWFKTNTTTGGKLIGFGNSQTGSSFSHDRALYMNNTGQLYFGVYYSWSVRTINSSASYNDNLWHLATVTFSTTDGMTMYVDGVQVAANATYNAAESSTGYWRIGYDNIGGWPSLPSSYYFKGTIDDVLIYQTALSSSQVATLYNSPDGAWNSGPVCTNSSVTLSATTIPGASYSWTGPNGFTSSAQNPTFTFTSAAVGTYAVTVTTPGCASGTTAYTNVVSGPAGPSLSASTTPTCIGGSTGSITATATGGTGPFTYRLNGGTYQSSTLFSGLGAGTYTLDVLSSNGCLTSIPVTISAFTAAPDNQTTAGSNSWIGHVYDGTNFNTYAGQYTQTETFIDGFGGTTVCLPLTSSAGARSIYTESFSVKYRMNSTKSGLYVVDLGSDDGSRFTVDNTLIYNNWVDQGYVSRPSVLLSLSGSSNLLYEFYENGGGNQVAFQNLTQVLANNLSANTTQSFCLSGSGMAISGDSFGTLPAGITLSGTGYQWSYSLTPGGTRTDISGATASTFTPSSSAAPFNTPGTYYLYRKAMLTSTNNISPNPYTATHVSNAATVIVTSNPSATISYTGSPYCSSAGTATVTRTGTAGGVFSSTTGLSINSATGAINLGASTAGTYIVTYTIAASGGCSLFSTTASITITTQPNATGTYINNPYCTTGGTVFPSGSATGALGTFASTAGLSINATTGAVNLGLSSPGTYDVIYTVPASGGCGIYTNSTQIVINAAPAATIGYAGSPFCTSGGTATVTRNGTSGGTFSSTTGLSINSSTGAINPAASTPGTYTVTYSIAASGGCAAFSTTTDITITAAQAATITYTGSPYCKNAGTATVSLSGTTGGTFSSTAGLSINSTTGAIDLAASTAGTYTVTYTLAAIGGCGIVTTTANVTIQPFISGTVFEDKNYGGGAGRSLAASSGIARSGARVELYDASGNFVSTTTTNVSGVYTFCNLTPGNYTVRVVNGTVTSSRGGTSLLPVQTYRTSATSGTAVAVTDHVGGQVPGLSDAGNGSASLSVLTTATTTPQSVTAITMGTSNITAVDFGYSFNLIVNNNNTGQGSLRQFITNANALSNAGMAQAGMQAGIDNAVFMLADGTSRPGLKAAYASQFTSGVASINVTTALPTITEPIILDAGLQPGYTSVPMIELNGTGTSAGTSGIRITAGSSKVRGFIVNRFTEGITLTTVGNNIITGNYVGTNSTGTAASPNTSIGISVMCNGNTIGGTSANDRNIISGNGITGITVEGGSGNTIIGNYMGTNAAGTAIVANTNAGLYLYNNANNNIIGGTAPGSANVISGNFYFGLAITSSTGNLIRGNFIGTNPSGTSAIANGTGIYLTVGVSGNVIGGTTAAERNIISGNGSFGAYVDQSSGVTFSGNYVGTNAAGTAGISNGSGLAFVNGANNITIGGTSPGAGNLISGNIAQGILLDGAGTKNISIQGNLIGTNASGTASIMNVSYGISLRNGANNNIIGGTVTGARNIISGNGFAGLHIGTATTTLNTVQGNYVGLNLAGTAGIPNGVVGVYILGGSGNTIGGATAAARNIISGNATFGLAIQNVGANNNIVQGNYVGLNPAGTAAIPNASTGIWVGTGAANNTIGGTLSGEGNVVSGQVNGITIDGGNNNLIYGNLVGTNATASSAIGNSGAGIHIINASNNNSIGGTQAGMANIISGNGTGITVAKGTGNAIFSNSIYANNTIGIDLNSDGASINNGTKNDTLANKEMDYPVISSATLVGNILTIAGHIGSAPGQSLFSGATIQVFKSFAGTGGFGEGQVLLGTLTADANGNFGGSITVAGIIEGDKITATATDATNNTSEFGANAIILAILTKTWDGGAGTNNWGDANNWNTDGVPSANDNVELTGTYTININVNGVAKNLTINDPNLVLTTTAGNSLSVNGDFILSAGTFNTETAFPSVTGTINVSAGTIGFTGTGTQTIPTLNYYNLVSSSTGNRLLANTGVIGIGGTFTPGNNTYISTGSTISYNANTSQNISLFDYHHLELANAGIKSFAPGKTGIAGNIIISGSASPDATTNSSTINYNGANNQSILNFTHYGLEVSGSATVSIGSSAAVTKFTMTSGTLDLATNTLSINDSATYIAGIINNGTITSGGNVTTFAGTTFGALVNATSNLLYLNGSTFNNTATLTKNGSTTVVSNGGNTFNSTASITHSGTGNITLGNVLPDIFNQNVSFTNSGTSGTIYVAHQSNGNQFNGNITVSNTAGGIQFGAGNGKSILAAGKTINTGSGFSSGTLNLSGFTQIGATAQSLALTGTGTLNLGGGATFNGNVNFISPRLLVANSTFNNITALTKNGSGDNISEGGNVFNGITIITNSGSGSLDLANLLPDTFHADVTINNTGTNRIQVGVSSAGTVFNGNVTVNHGGTPAANNTIIGRNSGATATINGNLVLNCTSNNASSGIIIANDAQVTVNGNILLSSSNGRGILFGAANGTVTLSNGFTISDAGAGTFTTGTLTLNKFIQQGSTAQNLTLTGAASLLIGQGTIFNGAVNFSAAQLVSNGARYNNDASLTKTGATDNTSSGGNIFNGITNITNSGTGFFRMANSSGDDFNGHVTFRQLGTGLLQPAYKSTTSISGNLSTVGSTTPISFGAGIGTLMMNGAGAQTIQADASPSFYNLTIFNSGNAVTPLINCSVTNSLTLSSGTLVLDGVTCNRTSAGGTLTISNGARLKLGGSNLIPSNFSTHSIGETSTVEFSGINQAIPLLNSAQNYGHLVISGTGAQTTTDIGVKGNITVSGSFNINSNTIRIGGNINTTGTFTAIEGTVEMNGTVPQTIPASAFATSFVRGLTINNNAGVTLQGALNLTDVLTISGGSLNSGGHLTLKSTQTATARVAPITSASLTPLIGNVNVERFVKGRRKYRLMTSSVTTLDVATLSPGQESHSIWYHWQNQGLNTTPNKGTFITGGSAADGFDTQTPNASLFTYDDVNRRYVGFTTANGKKTKYTPLQAGVAYYMFVYGDRLNTITTSNPNNTVLLSTGTLLTGDQNYTTSSKIPLSGVNGRFTLLGNPYASPIDWTTIQRSDLADTYWGWDPNVSSTGGYVTVSTVGNTILMAPYSGVTGLNQYIQPGQGFFVKTTGASPSMTIREQDKTGDFNGMAFRTMGTNDLPLIAVNIFYQSGTSKVLADGVIAAFDANFTRSIGSEDASKMANTAEGISIVNNGEQLSIEGRPMPMQNDTIYLNVAKLTKPQYTLQIFSQGLNQASAQPYLMDNYLATLQPLAMLDTNNIVFTVNPGIPATFDANRFRIVFKSNSALPVRFTSINAVPVNEDVKVTWSVAEEENIVKYEIERSGDGTSFSRQGEIASTGNNSTQSYSWMDQSPLEGNNYYRVRAKEANGNTFLSKMVMVKMKETTDEFNIYPNPVRNREVNVSISARQRGVYSLIITDAAGRMIINKKIEHAGGNYSHRIHLGNTIAAGVYNLKIFNDETTHNQKIMVE